MPEGRTINDYIGWGYDIFQNQTFSGFENAVICTQKDVAIAVSLIHGNTLDRIANSVRAAGLKRAYEMCNQSKYIYKVKYNKAFPVSTKSLAVELYLHSKPEEAVPFLRKFAEDYPYPDSLLTIALENLADYFHRHCKFSDMGIRTGWKKQMDTIFDHLYDELAG